MFSREDIVIRGESNEISSQPQNKLFLGSMVSPHIDHVMQVESYRKQQDVPNEDVKSECGLSLRGMHALCPAKDDKEMQMNSISLDNPFKFGENESGYFNMLIAENKLSWDMLSKKFQEVGAEVAPQWTGEYTRNRGEPGLCKGLARYMEKYWFGGNISVDWEGVCIQNGCVSSMEGLVHLLSNPGDTIIVPGPCYSVFVVDWWVRCQTRLQVANTSLETNFEPTIESLEEAYNAAVRGGSRVKALALIQPNNPTGRMLSKRCLE